MAEHTVWLSTQPLTRPSLSKTLMGSGGFLSTRTGQLSRSFLTSYVGLRWDNQNRAPPALGLQHANPPQRLRGLTKARGRELSLSQHQAQVAKLGLTLSPPADTARRSAKLCATHQVATTVRSILRMAPSQLPVQSEDLGERNAWHGSGGSGTGGREPANHARAHKDSLLPLRQACKRSEHLTRQRLQLWAHPTPGISLQRRVHPLSGKTSKNELFANRNIKTTGIFALCLSLLKHEAPLAPALTKFGSDSRLK